MCFIFLKKSGLAPSINRSKRWSCITHTTFRDYSVSGASAAFLPLLVHLGRRCYFNSPVDRRLIPTMAPPLQQGKQSLLAISPYLLALRIPGVDTAPGPRLARAALPGAPRAEDPIFAV